MREIVCPICGTKFKTDAGTRVYCSDDCRNAMRLDQRRKFRDKKQEAKRQEKARNNGAVIDAYALEAKERHISYGKLQIERTIKMLKEARK